MATSFVVRAGAYRELVTSTGFGLAYLEGEVNTSVTELRALWAELSEMIVRVVELDGKKFDTFEQLDEALFANATGFGMGLHEALRKYVLEACVVELSS